jgi:hypothetical protein
MYHTWGKKERSVFGALVGNPKGKRLLGKLRLKWGSF